MEKSTIAAIATPQGTGGIGIIKISGKDAISIGRSIFRRSRCSSTLTEETADHSFCSHQLYHGYVVDKETGKTYDEVLFTVMRAPYSYTREDVVEIQAHSGFVALSAILELVLKKGAKLAEAGEFTKRAFINGRIDLSQAEAVIDIINAKTQQSLEIAANQISGNLGVQIQAIRDAMMNILVEIEAGIDFPDDVGELIDSNRIITGIRSEVMSPLKDMLSRYENAHVLRDGLKLIVVGKPNVGKSSLMNRLIQKDRVIVTHVPGTTRDLVEETINIHGIPVIVTDSAGLHETNDPVEVIGIQKTHEYIVQSDLVLFMVDVSSDFTEADFQIYDRIKNKRAILVFNKSDLVKDGGYRSDIPPQWCDLPNVKTSALYNWGVDTLKELIAKICLGESAFDTRNVIIPNIRHKQALERSIQATEDAVRGIQEGTMFELVAIDIQEVIDSLGEIIGVGAREELLDQIFSRFCIGK